MLAYCLLPGIIFGHELTELASDPEKRPKSWNLVQIFPPSGTVGGKRRKLVMVGFSQTSQFWQTFPYFSKVGSIVAKDKSILSIIFFGILMQLGSNLPKWLLLGNRVLTCSKYWLKINAVKKKLKIVWKIPKKHRKKVLRLFCSLRVQMSFCYWWGTFVLGRMQVL